VQGEIRDGRPWERLLFRKSGEPRGPIAGYSLLALVLLGSLLVCTSPLWLILALVMRDRQPPPEESVQPLPRTVEVLDESTGCEGDFWCFRTVVVVDRSGEEAMSLTESLGLHFQQLNRDLVRRDDGCWIGDLDICPAEDPSYPENAVEVTATRPIPD
jgi:hypothetical protein